MVKAKSSKCSRKKTTGNRPAQHQSGRNAGNRTTFESIDADNISDTEEESLDSEDLQYLENEGRNLSFLSGFLKSSEITEKAGKKRKLKAEDHEEADYEKRPRCMLQDLKQTAQVLLPLKSKQGLIHRKVEPSLNLAVEKEKTEENKDEDTKMDSSSKVVNSNNKQAEYQPITSTVQLLATRQHKLMERKLQIASMASEIIENPEENIGMLKELCEFCQEKDVDIRITTKKLCMVSLVSVFKDIVPGYRIRLPTEAEKKIKVSKEVKKLREYEEGLLKCYQNFLQFLEQLLQDWVKCRDNNKTRSMSVNGFASNSQTLQRMAMLAVQCLCDLMTAVSHFNFRANILTVLVPWMNDRSLGNESVQKCCRAFHTLFAQDTSGEISLDAVKVIAKFIKAKGYNVQPCVLKTFLSLKINEMDVLSLRNKREEQVELSRKGKNRREKMIKGKMSKKDRKRKKETKKLEKELQEAEAVQSQETKAKLQTEMLNQVFVTYFRILKYGQQSPLLSTVLEGLARYSLLINVDFFADLMAALQTLVKSQNLPHKDKLNCVLTAFTILSGQGEALNIDPRGFYISFYDSLLHLHAGSTDADILIALKCLNSMINRRRRQVPVQRVAAFMKRILTQTVHLMANSSLAMLSCAKSLLQAHTKLHNLLESESVGTGVFRPEMDDPELSNADCTTAWELALLAGTHFHPAVRTLAGHVVNGAPSKGAGALMARTSSKEFHTTYDISQTLVNSFSSIKPSNKAVSKHKFRAVEEPDWNGSLIGSAVQNAQDIIENYSEIAFILPSNYNRRTKTFKQ